MKLLLELFLIFAKMGAVTFGGGYAMLPILQREIVENKHWGSEEELMDYYADLHRLQAERLLGRRLRDARRHHPVHDHHHGDRALSHPVRKESLCHSRLRRHPCLCLRPHSGRRREARQEVDQG